MLKELAFALILVGLSSGGPFSRLETAKPRADSEDYRLPDNVVPERYALKLIPDIPNAKFEGSVKIRIRVVKPTDTIVLHIRQLTIPNAETTIIVRDQKGNLFTVKEIAEETSKEFYKIILNAQLEQGVYLVEIPKFEGTLNNQNEGFYLAKYKDGDTEKAFATTQFEPTGARRAFPCFDEPALKATFQITITTPAAYNSVANMRLDSKGAVINDKQDYIFEETVEMSTYLLAFIVSELQLSDESKLHRVLAQQKDLTAGKAQFALTTGEAVLDKLKDFVNVPYSLDKMDQAAIPDQYFSAGAMENWGLVTYRETYLLYSEQTTQIKRHQSIATIIAHEFGHQWFGNLVTPEWWKYIWLNEGFATYFEHEAAAEALPDWKIMDQFVVENTQYVFGPDSLSNTRPMSQDAGTPQEISALFDRIAYEKSGSVIRMMEKFLTTAIFKKGLNYYLKASEYGVVTPTNLYEAMQKAVDEVNNKLLPSGLTVANIMETWEMNAGFPVVTVERKYDAKEDNVVLKQSQFLLQSTEDNDKIWKIPINFAHKSNPIFTDNGAEEWFTVKEQAVTVTDLDAKDWLIANKQQTGYYRVNYDEINWNLIIDALTEDHTKIDSLNRAQLIDDAFNLAKSKRLPYSIPLKLSTYLAKETEYIPFYPFFTEMSFLNGFITGTPIQNDFHNHIKALLSGVYGKIGFDENAADSHLDKLNRIPVLTWLCNLGHSECRTKSLEKFNSWKQTSNPITLNLQTPIFCGAMRGATQEDWDYLYTKYEETTDDTQLRSRMLLGLGCSENTAILNGFLDKILASTASTSRKQTEIASIYNSGPIGVKTTFDYVSGKFEEINTNLGAGLASVLAGISSKFSTETQLNELKALSEKHSEQSDLFKTALATAEANVQWNKDNLQSFTNFFSATDEDGGSISVTSSLAVTAASLIMCLLFK